MGIATIIAVPTAATIPLGAIIALAAPAGAEVEYQFLNNAPRVACTMSLDGGGSGHAICDIGDYSFNSQLPFWCAADHLVRFSLDEGQPADMGCQSGKIDQSLNVLGYGDRRTVGLIDCVNVENGASPRTECSDRASGHYFRIFFDHYETG